MVNMYIDPDGNMKKCVVEHSSQIDANDIGSMNKSTLSPTNKGREKERF
jgi:hypothetical protein